MGGTWGHGGSYTKSSVPSVLACPLSKCLLNECLNLILKNDSRGREATVNSRIFTQYISYIPSYWQLYWEQSTQCTGLQKNKAKAQNPDASLKPDRRGLPYIWHLALGTWHASRDTKSYNALLKIKKNCTYNYSTFKKKHFSLYKSLYLSYSHSYFKTILALQHTICVFNKNLPVILPIYLWNLHF